MLLPYHLLVVIGDAFHQLRAKLSLTDEDKARLRQLVAVSRSESILARRT